MTPQTTPLLSSLLVAAISAWLWYIGKEELVVAIMIFLLFVIGSRTSDV